MQRGCAFNYVTFTRFPSLKIFGHRYTPVPKSEFYKKIFRRIYYPATDFHEDVFDSHNLAVLYMILALGTLLDLEKPSNSPEAAGYYQLGRAVLSLDSVLETQSVLTIQALVTKPISSCDRIS